MSNKEILQNYNSRLDTHNISLNEVIGIVNELPDIVEPKYQSKSIEITENGTQIIIADDGYDALSNVEIVTNAVEDLDEELTIQNEELTEQKTSLELILSKIGNKAIPGGSSEVPSEYKRLLYIESTGTQYIETGVIPNTYLGFEIDYLSKNTLENPGTLFGYRYMPYSHGYHLTLWTSNPTTKKGHFLFGTSSEGAVESIRYNAGITPNKREKIIFHNKTLSRPDGTSQTFTTNTQINTSGTIVLFALRQNTILAEHSHTQLYDLKFTYSGNPFKHFIPAMRKSDNVVGLYEKVSGEFYTNAGTGTFLYGEIEG